jgi:multisubunit Na+/H+ antiporter MnhC subunit
MEPMYLIFISLSTFALWLYLYSVSRLKEAKQKKIEEEIEKWSWGSEKALNCMLTIFILTLIIIFFSFKEFLKLKLTNWVIIFSLSILFTAWVRIMVRRNEKT